MSFKLRFVFAILVAFGLSFGVVACEQKAEEKKEEKKEEGGEAAEGEAAEGEGEAAEGEGEGEAAAEGEGEAAAEGEAGAAEGEGEAAADAGADQWLKITVDHNDDKGPVEAMMDMELTSAVIDLENLDKSMAEFTVDLSTFKTDNDQRDGHVKSPDFFDVGQYPKATIKIHGIQPEENGAHKATASMDLRGTQKDVPVEFKIVEKKDDGSLIIEGSAQFMRMDFGVGAEPEKANVKNEIAVAIRMHVAAKG